MKVNEKKIEQVLIPLPKAASILSEAKNMKKKIFVPMDSWDNPIYPISEPRFDFLVGNVDFLSLSNFALMFCGQFLRR